MRHSIKTIHRGWHLIVGPTGDEIGSVSFAVDVPNEAVILRHVCELLDGLCAGVRVSCRANHPSTGGAS